MGLCSMAVGGAWLAYTMLSDLPDLESVADYRPPLTSVVLDRDRHRIGEFSVERRSLASMEEIPELTRQAFVSAEDGNFFEHGGVDLVSIARAAWVDITEGRIKQGASTITMQLVKQMLLTRERTFRRKFREMILARQLEERFSKDEILWLYLNQIYFGQGAWGISEAARTYFDKDVTELTLSESALLAGLPQRPSEYSPTRNPKAAEKRRRYALGRMLTDGAIDRSTYEEALATPPVLKKPAHRKDMHASGYFTEEVRRFLYDQLGADAVVNGGLVIETTLDIALQNAAVNAVRKGLTDHDKRQGYRGPVRQVEEEDFAAEILELGKKNKLVPALEDPVLDQLPSGVALEGLVTELDNKAHTATVAFAPGLYGIVRMEDVSWGRTPNPRRMPYVLRKIRHVFSVGDVTLFEVIEGEDAEEASSLSNTATAAPARVTILQRPLVQGALLSIDVASGDVLALVGGYDFNGSEFNRATQAKRQPGSAFKPLIYGAALEDGYTPVTTLWDRPAVYTDPESGFVWRPQNYGREFYGPMPLRTALARSVNNATVHLFRDVGVKNVIDYAHHLGIQSDLNRDLSLALGSSDVTLLELTTAYAIFPNRGRRVRPRFINRVLDRNGTVLFEDVALGKEPPTPIPTETFGDTEIADSEEAELGEQVISPESAFLMTDLLKAVVFDEDGTGWRLKDLRRPVAGKTGTTNDQADAWFMGFSPNIVTGVWVGHDESRVLGRGETGSRAASPIWIDYMKVALRRFPRRDFEAPEGIVFQRVDHKTGLLADASTEEAYFQPFLEGTEPQETAKRASAASDTARALRDDSF